MAGRDVALGRAWAAPARLGFGIALMLAITLLGCGRPGSSPAHRLSVALPPDTLTFDGPELGRYGGRFVIAETGGPRTFNAIMSNDQPSNDVNQRLFIGLTEFDLNSQQTVPSLARSWDHTPDGRTWTFHLRRGARFSDGHSLTAEDVLFSFAVVYDDSLHPSVQDLLKVNGRKFELSAPDSHTVVFRLAGSMALFPTLVGAVRIMPRHLLEPEWKRGAFASAFGVGTPPERIVSSGAWRLSRYVAGERTVLSPNPYWFGVDRSGRRLPYLDELVFESVPDQNTAALRFEAGEVDAVDSVRPEDYGLYERRSKAGHFTLYDVGPSLISNFLWFNLNRREAAGKEGAPVVDGPHYRWFADPRFRQAVSKAIDRDAIIRGPFFGFAFKNWSTMTKGSHAWYTPAVAGPDYDPEGSKRLLAEMGLRDRDGDGTLEDADGRPVGFSLKTNSDNETRIAIDNLIKDDLARVGIQVTSLGVDLKTLITNVRSDFDYQAVSLGLGSAVPSDPAMAANFYRSSGASHYWHVRQKRPATDAERQIDSLFEIQADTLDDAVRHDAWRRMQDLVNQECFVIWLPSQIVKLPVRDGFGNLHPVALPHRILWNIDRVFVRARGR